MNRIATYIAALVIIAMMALLWTGSGCIAREVRAIESIGLDVQQGPPCIVTVTADGAVASRITGPRCVFVLQDDKAGE